MPDWKPSPIAGKFYTVEDLMNLPAAGAVNPAKAREVSRALPVRFWIDTPELIKLLTASMEIIEANKENAPPADARQGEVLIAQRRLWIRHLEKTDEEETFIGIFPASFAGDEYDQEEAVTD
jgi:hypothetical protein